MKSVPCSGLGLEKIVCGRQAVLRCPSVVPSRRHFYPGQPTQAAPSKSSGENPNRQAQSSKHRWFSGIKSIVLLLFRCFPVPVYGFRSSFFQSLDSGNRSRPESSSWTDNCLNRCERLSAASKPTTEYSYSARWCPCHREPGSVTGKEHSIY